MDSPERMRETLADEPMPYALYSDHRAEAARAFGIAWRVSEAERKKLLGYGIDIEAASGEQHHLLPVPSVFLVDRGGVVRFRHANPDYKVRIENEALLKAAREVAQAAP